MLVMRRPGAITHPLAHKESEVEDRASSLKEKSGQNRDSVARTSREKMVSRTASRQEGGRIDISILEGHGSGW